MQIISLIAAMSENRVIGRANKLPWKMPADITHFKKITKGCPFIMGRKSFLSEDRLLSDKLSIILTHHSTDHLHSNCIKAESLGEALSILANEPKIFILGGGEVFRQSLSIANFMYLTLIHTFIEGDTFFPEFENNQWKLMKEDFHKSDNLNPYDYSFQEFARC